MSANLANPKKKVTTPLKIIPPGKLCDTFSLIERVHVLTTQEVAKIHSFSHPSTDEHETCRGNNVEQANNFTIYNNNNSNFNINMQNNANIHYKPA